MSDHTEILKSFNNIDIQLEANSILSGYLNFRFYDSDQISEDIKSFLSKFDCNTNYAHAFFCKKWRQHKSTWIYPLGHSNDRICDYILGNSLYYLSLFRMKQLRNYLTDNKLLQIRLIIYHKDMHMIYTKSRTRLPFQNINWWYFDPDLDDSYKKLSPNTK